MSSDFNGYGPEDAPQARLARKAGFHAGLRAVRPTLIAMATWGLVTGVAMVQAGLPENLALAMTLIVYAGSAQLTSLPLIASGAPLWMIFAAGTVVNLRFVIFGAALQPFFRNFSWPRRLVLGFLSTDLSFVLFMPRYNDSGVRGSAEQLGFYLGVVVPSWLAWQAASCLGIALGSTVPASWSLDFAAVLALLAITIPLANTRPALVALLAAAAVAWAGQPLPFRLGLVAAIVAGVGVGMAAERFSAGAEHG